MKALLLIFALPLMAHDMYLIPQKFTTQPGETLLISVHNGDSFPRSEGPVDPRRLTIVMPGGQKLENFTTMNKATHGFWKVDRSGSVYVTAETSPRSIEMTPSKFEAYLQEEGLESIIEYRKRHRESNQSGRELYSKAAKTLIVSGSPDDAWKQALGLPLEFIPVTDPSSLSPGGTLKFRVLFQGQPIAGVQVEKAWASTSKEGHQIVGRTNWHGEIDISLEHAGKWRLHALTMKRSDDAATADWRSYWASLTFEVRESMTTSNR